MYRIDSILSIKHSQPVGQTFSDILEGYLECLIGLYRNEKLLTDKSKMVNGVSDSDAAQHIEIPIKSQH